MNPENSLNASISPMAVPVTQSAEWTEHEHVSEHVQLEAQKLVDLVGSSELARNAINVADQRQASMPAGDETTNQYAPLPGRQGASQVLGGHPMGGV